MSKRKIIKAYWKRILFSISLLIFGILIILLLTDNISTFDNTIYNIIIRLKCEPVTYFFIFISFLCSTWFIFFLAVGIMIFSKNKKNAFYIVLNILLCVVLNQVLKYLFARSRPIDINLVLEQGFSFPSGHSMVSLSFYGFVTYIIVHKKISKKKKVLFSSLLISLVLLIGISRIYLGVHYASDVCAGYALSMAYLLLYIKLFYNKLKT